MVVTAVLGADVGVDGRRIAESLAVAVVAPMCLAVAVRTRYGDRVGRYDDYYEAVSALAVVLIIGGVTGANAGLVRANADLLAGVAAGAVALNLAGYALGWGLARSSPRPARVAATLSVGMRDFAVAAGLVTAAGFPASASLPAVAFGVVEMATSALLARRFSTDTGTANRSRR